MSEAEKSRRETLKLAAAVAAFGAALGFRQTAEGGTVDLKKMAGYAPNHYIKLIDIKFYTHEGKPLYSCSVPETTLKMHKMSRVDYKVFVNGKALPD